MPLVMGFHTTFTEPDRFSVPLGKRWERDKRYLPTGRLMELNGREKQITQAAGRMAPLSRDISPRPATGW